MCPTRGCRFNGSDPIVMVGSTVLALMLRVQSEKSYLTDALQGHVEVVNSLLTKHFYFLALLFYC